MVKSKGINYIKLIQKMLTVTKKTKRKKLISTH